MLAHVDLCSGIGGFALGFQRAGLSQPVLFCDIEPWSRQVLAKHWPDVPIAEDVKELASDPRRLVPDCDILTAGYPCQPFSQAGIRRGEEDDRHIWPEIFTIVETKLPRWCVFENVSGHISLGLDQVLSDLESKGYDVQPFVVPACAVDAPHRRDRVWIIAAHADSQQRRATEKHGELDLDRVVLGQRQGPKKANAPQRSGADVADTDGERLQGQRPKPSRISEEQRDAGDSCRRDIKSGVGGTLPNGLSAWMDEPRDIPRVATGVKQRAARLKGLGNAIVPQIAMQIGLTIKAVEHG
jgi:DNA (cytosine-5)-methyltransferase 1